MSEREHDDRTDHADDDARPDSGLIPDADAGETDADSVARDEGDKGHEEYKQP